VVTSLFSFSSSDTTCLQAHADALQCVTACLTLCTGFTVDHLSPFSSLDGVHNLSEQFRKQVELAVAFKSAGVFVGGRVPTAVASSSEQLSAVTAL
jgi:hypothetical protein